MPVLTLIIAEAALETVPEELWREPSVVKHAKRRGKSPGQILLDRSYHHSAMLKLEHAKKRGRPDIVHMALLSALETPLNREGLLRTYVHTFNDYVIEVRSEVRLPRNYDRFVGLIEQLFELGRVPPEGRPLLSLRKQTLRELIAELKPSRIVGFTRHGEPKPLEETMRMLAREERPLVLVGGFARGTFAEETKKLAHELVSIDSETLETFVVVSRAIYEFERALNVSERRLGTGK